MKVAFFISVLAFSAAELDPGAMRKGDVGTLPKTSKNDDVLVVMYQRPEGGRTYEVEARFFFKDKATVEDCRKSKATSIELPMDGTYEVVGTKTAGGKPAPRLIKKS